MSITIRELTIKDIELYKNIRLELLLDAPTNFGSSYDEEKAFSSEMWINRLNKETVITLGAFYNDELVGLTVCVMNPRKKMVHVASIHSVYVKEPYRKMKIAKSLITESFQFLKEHNVEVIHLSVVSENIKAIKLYESLGFTTYGLEPRTIKYNNNYYDLLLMSKSI